MSKEKATLRKYRTIVPFDSRLQSSHHYLFCSLIKIDIRIGKFQLMVDKEQRHNPSRLLKISSIKEVGKKEYIEILTIVGQFNLVQPKNHSSTFF